MDKLSIQKRIFNKNIEGFIQHYFFSKKSSAGFTLIELLIVIAIIAILAGVVFVALNPLKRFEDSRNSRRSSDLTNILNAIKVNQTDNGGAYINAVTNMANGNVYMIGTGSSGCNFGTGACATATTAGCVDLTGLVTAGQLGSVPISPKGASTWSELVTGYSLSKSSTGIITARACENEGTNTPEIVSSR